jgi:hypothetical protein
LALTAFPRDFENVFDFNSIAEFEFVDFELARRLCKNKFIAIKAFVLSAHGAILIKQ